MPATQGLTESLLSLSSQSEQSKMNTMGPIDEKVDGIIIINAAGIIMMVNQVC